MLTCCVKYQKPQDGKIVKEIYLNESDIKFIDFIACVVYNVLQFNTLGGVMYEHSHFCPNT